MVEFTGNSGNILPQIMLLTAWESKERERDGGRGGEKKEKTDEDDVCLSKRRGQTLKQQKLKAKGTCSHLASCSLAECSAMAFTRSQ